jgi:hypothetical protein
MAPDLSSARTKRQRANDHVNNLQREWVLFLGGDPYKVVRQFNAEANKTAFLVAQLPVLPVSLSTILGDAVHNFRSALDHLAFALFASANPGKSGSRIYFPIGKNKTEYASISQGKTQGIPQALKDRIDSFCPYGGANNLLWPLHKLDIMDKHQLIVPVASVNAGVGIAGDAGGFARGIISFPSMKILVAGDLLLERSGNLVSDKGIGFSFDIAFSELETLKGYPVFVALSLIAGQVGHIIDSFQC